MPCVGPCVAVLRIVAAYLSKLFRRGRSSSRRRRDADAPSTSIVPAPQQRQQQHEEEEEEEVGGGGGGRSHRSLLDSLLALTEDISSIGEPRSAVLRRECLSLIRRVKLLVPLFEELRESSAYPLTVNALSSLVSLEAALCSAKALLYSCQHGSQIHLVLERESIAEKIAAVMVELDQALNRFPYDMLDSDEVREQVELVHSQLKRTKTRPSAQDMELCADLAVVLSRDSGTDVYRLTLARVSKKLHLQTLLEIEQESQLVHQILRMPGGNDAVNQNMLFLLQRLEEFCINVNTGQEADTHHHKKAVPEDVTCLEDLNSAVLPDDFRCPISLELMRDPVIVATGQTYERICIQKWLEAGNKTCPKTRQTLPHFVLTPNYALRSLIAEWCDARGIDVNQTAASKIYEVDPKVMAAAVAADRKTVDALVEKLRSGEAEIQRAAASELRFLAKRNSENRVSIAKAGAIPLLICLLNSSGDSRTQEHAVTALLNLSIHEFNKTMIVDAGAVGPMVDVLRSGSMEARENAAAALFSLSVVDENKVAIGTADVFPSLVALLGDGSLQGKKDAAAAIFNLCMHKTNKARAVRAGVVPPLIQILMDSRSEMRDEALAIIAILVTHHEGRAAIGLTPVVPILVELFRAGTPRNKENAAGILLALSSHDPMHMLLACQLGAPELLNELAQSGTARARRKATALLEHLGKHKQEQTAEILW